MLRRLLMAAGGGASFATPPTPFTVTAAPEGGWTEIQHPHAMYAGGVTYIGYVRGNTDDNDIVVAAWDHAARAITATFQLHDQLSDGTSTVPDTHNAPAVLVLNDGHILAAYSGHQSTTIRVRRSTSANDISAFGSEVTISTVASTYMQLAQLASGTIYLRFRGDISGDRWLYQTKSTDGGATWATPIQLFGPGTGNVYSSMAYNASADRIDHVLINRSPTVGYGLWHFYTDSSGMHHLAGGTFADPSFYWVTSDLNEIVADGGDAYPYAVSYTLDDRPVVACQSKLVDPVELFEYRWSGSTWDRHDIATSDPIRTGILTMGGFAHDWADSQRALVPAMIGGPLDMGGDMALYEYRSTDDGVTWDSGRLVTTGPDQPSSAVAVTNRGTGLAFLWFEGDPADSDGDPYSLGLKGLA